MKKKSTADTCYKNHFANDKRLHEMPMAQAFA
jgi:hypothetical protein